MQPDSRHRHLEFIRLNSYHVCRWLFKFAVKSQGSTQD
ncbi:hypothetical protein A2U01_0084714, partial [Trifolium medium]|nr:hypothetical protein [Trifolium medium]